MADVTGIQVTFEHVDVGAAVTAPGGVQQLSALGTSIGVDGTYPVDLPSDVQSGDLVVLTLNSTCTQSGGDAPVHAVAGATQLFVYRSVGGITASGTMNRRSAWWFIATAQQVSDGYVTVTSDSSGSSLSNRGSQGVAVGFRNAVTAVSVEGGNEALTLSGAQLAGALISQSHEGTSEWPTLSPSRSIIVTSGTAGIGAATRLWGSSGGPDTFAGAGDWYTNFLVAVS